MKSFKEFIKEVNQCVGKTGEYHKTMNPPTIEPKQIVNLKSVDVKTKKKKRLKRPDKAERRKEANADKQFE